MLIGCIRVARNYNTLDCRLRASLSVFADDRLILTLCSVEIKSLMFMGLASCGMITLGKQLTLFCHFVDKPGDFLATFETFGRFLNSIWGTFLLRGKLFVYFPPTLLDLIYYLFTMQYVALFFVTNLVSTLTKRVNRLFQLPIAN